MHGAERVPADRQHEESDDEPQRFGRPPSSQPPHERQADSERRDQLDERACVGARKQQLEHYASRSLSTSAIPR